MFNKIMRRAVVVICVSLLLCGAIYAGDIIAATEFYDVRKESGDVAQKVTLTFQRTDKDSVVEAKARDEAEACYFEAIRGTLTYAGAVSGQRYVVLITKGELTENGVKDEDIAFVREVKADGDSGSITVDFYPATMKDSQKYYIYLSGSAGKDSPSFRELVATFEYRAYLLGDVYRDGTVGMSDALYAIKISAQTTTYEDWQFIAADVDRSGQVTAVDALAIAHKAADPDYEFPNSKNGS